jgi:GH35 family endo-1,4-beta-xylanase
MKRFLTLLCCLLLTTCAAQPERSSGQSLLRPVPSAQLNFSKEGLGGVKAYQRKEGQTVMRLTTTTRPDNIYNLSRSIPLKNGTLKAGRVLLLSFEAKTEQASLETGEGKLLCLLRQSESHKDNLAHTVSIGNSWRRYNFPYKLTEDVAPSKLVLNFQFGYPEQEVLIRGTDLALYPVGTLVEDLPRTKITYAGRATDATWRGAAARRIEKHRKGSFSLQFVDAEGNPLSDMPTAVTLKRHHCGWGAAINAQAIIKEPERLDRIAQTFNTIVFENDLKIKRWRNENYRKNTLSIMDSLAARNVSVKGHVLIWPGFQYLPPVIRENRDKPDQVTRLMDRHVEDILQRTAGKVSRWDVVNEAYSNRDLQEITGSEEILYNGFRKLAGRDSSIGRFTNEFGIISRGGHDVDKQQWYYDYIERVDDQTGGLVDGIGIQCHMGSDLTPPERVLELLNYYGELNKQISISEFTIDLDDPELRFDYTRDFMTIAFSHPSVSEFLFWGYHGGTHPKASIFTPDWRFGDMGLAFRSLVHQQWTTEVIGKTDEGGRIQGRGYYGDYEYRFPVNGQMRTGYFSLVPGTAAVLTITVP